MLREKERERERNFHDKASEIGLYPSTITYFSWMRKQANYSWCVYYYWMNDKYNNIIRVFTVLQVFKECSYVHFTVEDRFNRVVVSKQAFFGR
jgi:hypothetical protein